MRILVLTNRLSLRGGADWHLLGVIRELLRQHQVHLVIGRHDGTAQVSCSVEIDQDIERLGWVSHEMPSKLYQRVCREDLNDKG